MRTRLISTLLVLSLSGLRAEAAFMNLGVLGDSLSDTGNLSAAVAEVTSGLVRFPLPPYYEGRFSNGPVWVDYFEAENPDINVRSIAFGGALSGTFNGYDNIGDPDLERVPIFGDHLADAALGLGGQLQQVPDVTGTDTAFVLWIGANDLNSATSLGFARPQDIVQASLGNVGSAITTLLARGASALYVANLPDLGRTPSALAGSMAADLTQATVDFNVGLGDLIDSHGSEVRLVDMFAAFNDVLEDPQSFGFADVSTPCVDGFLDRTPCADPDAHLFWDPVHPSTAAHALLVDMVGDYVESAVVPLPPAWVLLLPALACLALRGRRGG